MPGDFPSHPPDGVPGPPVLSRACPLCGSDHHATLLVHGEWQLVRCVACGLPHLPRIPAQDRVTGDLEWHASFSRVRRRRWLHAPWMRAWTLAATCWRPSREARALRWVRRFVPCGRLLDVGCGTGRLVAAAGAAGYDAHGVDVSPVMVKKALRRLSPDRIRCGRLEDQTWPRRFDIVTTVSYLEHEPSPARVVHRIHALLVPGGFSFHKVPNFDSHLRRVLGRRWSGYRWPEHLQYFTPATLGRLCTEAGLEVVAVRAHRLGDNFWLAARKPPAPRERLETPGGAHD